MSFNISSISKTSNNKLNEQDRSEIYDFLVKLVNQNNRNSSIKTLLNEDNLKMKHIIMYKYLIIDSFNKKDYYTVNECYTKLLELLKKNSEIRRYIYALIIYISIEKEFYSANNKFNINMTNINTIFKKDSQILSSSESNRIRSSEEPLLSVSNNNYYQNNNYNEYHLRRGTYTPPPLSHKITYNNSY